MCSIYNVYATLKEHDATKTTINGSFNLNDFYKILYLFLGTICCVYKLHLNALEIINENI